MDPEKRPPLEGQSAIELMKRVPRASIVAIGIVVAVGTAVGVSWRHLIDIHQPFDPLLAGLWVGMTLLLAWRIRPKRDLVLVFSACCGGFLIEWWGTTTELWTYFTSERPPLWIIPAWPVAALATDRLTMMIERLLPTRGTWRWRILYFGTLAAFVVAMFAFMKPGMATTSSRAVLVIMVVVTATPLQPRRDVALFAAGSALGWLLEYWGTTSHCWTYYTHQTPPLVTAFAHGFASVAFGRAADVLLWTIEQAWGSRTRATGGPIRTG
jgi:hypothetical protein